MKNLPISVCMPMYNASRYLRECIDSILAQTFTDFELLIVDDGSTDESVKIVESYHDPRIRLIKNKHDYIASLNLLLSEAKGKYIARMDADDVMLPERLAIQYKYMEEHPEVDVMAGALKYIDERFVFTPAKEIYECTLELMMEANLVANPASIFNRESILEHSINYEEDFIYAEDYRFWTRILMEGLKIHIIPTTLIKYRYSNAQITSCHRDEMFSKTHQVQEHIRTHLAVSYNIGYKMPQIENRGKQLSIIIPFLNEGEEVLLTIESIRNTIKDTADIIVINDCSIDGVDYQEMVKDLQVYYILNRKRKGVAASRDLGIKLCKTPYFLLLDAHMRFYEEDWAIKIINKLIENERQLLCCQGLFLSKRKDGTIISQDKSCCFGAFMPCLKNTYLPDIKWNTFEQLPNELEETIPFVLGAGYAASCQYWKYLRGLEGLEYYGSDEAYISLKVWMEGGKCTLLKNVVIGHIYREEAPYKHYNVAEVFNYLWISRLLFSSFWKYAAEAAAIVISRPLYLEANKLFKKKQSQFNELKKYYNKIFTKDFIDVMQYHQNIRLKNLVRISDTTLNLLPKIAIFLQKNTPRYYGLYKGKMGHLIWFEHYSRYCGCSLWDDLASDLWEQIEQAIKEDFLPLNFEEGLLGIGWSILYLYEKKFLDDYPETILSKIDQNVNKCSPHRLEENDIKGLLCYCAARLKYSFKRKEKFAWSQSFIEELLMSSKTIIENSNNSEAITLALMLIDFMENKYDLSDWELSLSKCIDFKQTFPQNAMYWESGLCNPVASVSMLTLLLIEQK